MIWSGPGSSPGLTNSSPVAMVGSSSASTIFFPVSQELGYDPIWFGVIIVMTVELGLITPPVGMNVFVINSIARDISLTKIFKGVLPFVAADIIRLVLLVAVPAPRHVPEVGAVVADDVDVGTLAFGVAD